MPSRSSSIQHPHLNLCPHDPHQSNTLTSTCALTILVNPTPSPQLVPSRSSSIQHPHLNLCPHDPHQSNTLTSFTTPILSQIPTPPPPNILHPQTTPLNNTPYPLSLSKHSLTLLQLQKHRLLTVKRCTLA